MGFPNKIQLEFINEPLSNDMSLLGIPGGGKTTTIIHKIVKLFNEYNYKRDNFLLISKCLSSKKSMIMSSVISSPM